MDFVWFSLSDADLLCRPLLGSVVADDDDKLIDDADAIVRKDDVKNKAESASDKDVGGRDESVRSSFSAGLRRAAVLSPLVERRQYKFRVKCNEVCSDDFCSSLSRLLFSVGS